MNKENLKFNWKTKRERTYGPLVYRCVEVEVYRSDFDMEYNVDIPYSVDRSFKTLEQALAYVEKEITKYIRSHLKDGITEV